MAGGGRNRRRTPPGGGHLRKISRSSKNPKIRFLIQRIRFWYQNRILNTSRTSRGVGNVFSNIRTRFGVRKWHFSKNLRKIYGKSPPPRGRILLRLRPGVKKNSQRFGPIKVKSVSKLIFRIETLLNGCLRHSNVPQRYLREVLPILSPENGPPPKGGGVRDTVWTRSNFFFQTSQTT